MSCLLSLIWLRGLKLNWGGLCVFLLIFRFVLLLILIGVVVCVMFGMCCWILSIFRLIWLCFCWVVFFVLCSLWFCCFCFLCFLLLVVLLIDLEILLVWWFKFCIEFSFFRCLLLRLMSWLMLVFIFWLRRFFLMVLMFWRMYFWFSMDKLLRCLEGFI